ncbi:MAG: YeeE/YedE family protein [Cellvibrionaceae bacterium]|nr:YeeE/YedE family protein [Cellvibrionaceae bacterium]
MEQANILGGLIGGAMIGLAASVLFILSGKIAGISGMLGRVFSRSPWPEKYWHLAFLVGLMVGAGLYGMLTGGLSITLQRHGLLLLIAGFIVGVGTGLGSGCTSGHGICGIARLSKRSIAATAVFMVSAITTVFITKQVGL